MKKVWPRGDTWIPQMIAAQEVQGWQMSN
jgi:hypothetical protein